MICRNCDKDFPDDFRFCDSCGGPLEIDQNSIETIESTETTQENRLDYNNSNQVSAYSTNKNQYPSFDKSQFDMSGEAVGISEWLSVLWLVLIPFMGWLIFFIVMLIWAFASTKQSKKTFARAALIVLLVGVVLCVFMITIIGLLFQYYQYHPIF